MGAQTGGPARRTDRADDRIAELQRQIEELQDTPDEELQHPAARAPKRDRYARQREEAEQARTSDFDSWRDRQKVTTPKITIAGRVFALPKQAPLMFTLERRRMESGHELSEAEVRKMIGMLLGPDGLDHLVDHGYDHDDLSVLLIWGGANVGATSERFSLDEAAAEYRRMQEREAGRAEGNGQNRAARRRSGKRGRGRQSSSTGH